MPLVESDYAVFYGGDSAAWRALRVLVVALITVFAFVAAVLPLTRPSGEFERLGTLRQIKQAQERFREYGVDSYTVDVQRSCMCDTNGLTFTLTVEDGDVTRVAVTGFRSGDPRRSEPAEWDHVPAQYDWLSDWGPTDSALGAAARTAMGDTYPEGPGAIFAPKGDHRLVTKFSFHRRSGVPHSFLSYVTNTFDSQVAFEWSGFQPRNP